MTDVRIKNDQINYGNLTGLIGTWMGANGFNLIAVPNQKGSFKLLVAPYVETLVVKAVPATTPNRGLNDIARVPTLQYSTTILDSRDNSLMHVENGFWELVDKEANDGCDIFRLASIPHGDALVAMGVSSKFVGGAPVIDTSLSAMPTGDFGSLLDYTEQYTNPKFYREFSKEFPNQYLADFLTQLIKNGPPITSTVELNVSTDKMGGINNIPSLSHKNAMNVTRFDATGNASFCCHCAKKYRIGICALTAPQYTFLQTFHKSGSLTQAIAETAHAHERTKAEVLHCVPVGTKQIQAYLRDGQYVNGLHWVVLKTEQGVLSKKIV